MSSLGVLAITLAACGGDSTGRRGGQAVIGEGAELAYPNPLVSESNIDNAINSMLYMQLLDGVWQDGELVYVAADQSPRAAARSYELFGPDSASLRYHLRTDIRWSDGQPITAHDVKWSLESQGSPELASPRLDYNREIRAVEVEDDSTVVVHFNRRYPDMLFHTTAAAFAPRHPYADHPLSQLRSHPAVTNPAGGSLVTSGPYVVAQWIRGQRVVLERNPYFEPQPVLDRIIWRVIPEETTRLIELQTGNLDRTLVPFSALEDIRRTGNFRIEAQQKRSYEYVAYNPRAHSFFADPEIRRALGLAIDKDGLIRALELSDFAVAAGGPYPPIFRRLYDPEGQSPLPHDPEQARRILEGKGWRPGPDGILTREGVPFRFTLMTNGDNRRRVDMAQILERQWRQIGVDVRIQTLEFNTSIERATQRNFEAYIGGWGVGLSPDLASLWGDPDAVFNFVSYDNAEVRRLMEMATDQPTADLAAPYWRQAASLIAADQPYTWLYYHDRPHAIVDRLRNTVVDVVGEYGEVWNWTMQ